MSYVLDFTYGTLPNGWPQPTFISVDDHGGLNIEWCFGAQGSPESWRVLFSWDPEEGAMICRTTEERQDFVERPAEGTIAATLHEWLTVPPSSTEKDR